MAELYSIQFPDVSHAKAVALVEEFGRCGSGFAKMTIDGEDVDPTEPLGSALARAVYDVRVEIREPTVADVGRLNEVSAFIYKGSSDNDSVEWDFWLLKAEETDAAMFGMEAASRDIAARLEIPVFYAAFGMVSSTEDEDLLFSTTKRFKPYDGPPEPNALYVLWLRLKYWPRSQLSCLPILLKFYWRKLTGKTVPPNCYGIPMKYRLWWRK